MDALNQSIARLREYVPVALQNTFAEKPQEKRDGSGHACRFMLSPMPDLEWIRRFENSWVETFPRSSLKVLADQHHVTVVCPLEDVPGHFPKLRQVVEVTNAAMKVEHDLELKKDGVERQRLAEEDARIAAVQALLKKL